MASQFKPMVSLYSIMNRITFGTGTERTKRKPTERGLSGTGEYGSILARISVIGRIGD